MKKMIKIIAFLTMVIIIVGCSSNTGVTLSFQSSNPGSRVLIDPPADRIDIDRFILSIRSVEFKQDENAPDSSGDVYFEGPFVLDLLDNTGFLMQTIGSAPVPAGNYQEVRFKLHKTTDLTVDSDIYDRSIYLAGTIDGTPFEMWHDTSENLDVGKASGIIVSDVDALALTINFDVDSFLDQSANAAEGGTLIDLFLSSDADGDGIIEIHPNSTDDGESDQDNRDAADFLKDNIKLVADFL